MSFGYLFSKLLVLIIFLAVGFIANKTDIITADGNKKFTKIVLNICQPAIVLSSAFGADIDLAFSDVFLLIGVSCLIYAVLFIISFATARFYGKTSAENGVYKFMMVFGNIVFMAYPVINAIFGSNAVFIASICNLPVNFLIYSVGLILITGKKGKSHIDIKLFLNVPLIATVIAMFIFFMNFKIPGFISEATESLGNMIVPSSMLVLGASLGGASFRQIFGEWRAYVLCVFKLLIMPTLVWLICREFIKDELFLGVFVTLAAMPVASLAPMLALEYGGDTLTASRGVFLSTLFSMLTIPLVTLTLLA